MVGWVNGDEKMDHVTSSEGWPAIPALEGPMPLALCWLVHPKGSTNLRAQAP